MKTIVAFAAGALVGAALALYLALSSPEAPDGACRQRVEQAERELAEERRKSAAMASQMRGLAERFDALAARLETLSSVAAEALRAPGAEGTADPGVAANSAHGAPGRTLSR